uniref:FAS1 domain-containing protein n=1 Tax=Tetradesmus obliquus TaxID=3088 RepID=A0A383WIZ7_TETOB|eukprot:jgi/Sobl393_1/8022/SZX77084.1
MHKLIALFLALGAVAVQVRAADTHAIDTLNTAKLSSFKSLIDLAGATAAFSNEKARVTLLAPTDEAVAAFLTSMGITLDDLKADENLVDKIVGYHTVIGVTAGPKELFAKGDSVIVPTASAPFKVKIDKTADGVTVTDYQGNVAKVVDADLGTNNARVHAIDKVLFSGSYWTDMGALIKAQPTRFSTVAKAADAAGLAATLTAQGFADTIFLPTNEAFEKSGVKLDAPAETIAEVLKYHVVKGDKNIPAGFTDGAAVPTLQGQDITVTFVETESVAGMPAKKAVVTDAAGGKAEVVQPNIHISKPAAAAPAPAAAAATAEAPAAGKGSIFAIFQALWPFHKDGMRITIKFADGKGGRKLMQMGQSGAGMYTETLALDSTEQAILNAVNSDTASATAGAAAAGEGNALLSTTYPINPTYADGIDRLATYGTGGN